MSGIKWPLMAAVCAAHLMLISVFSAVGGAGSTGPKNTGSQVRPLALTVVQSGPPITNTSTALLPPAPEAVAPVRKLRSPLPDKARDQTAASPSAPSTGLALTAGPDKAKFLDADALDETALESSLFNTALNDALPSRFELIVLELLIDETGRTVSALCIEGDCNDAVARRLQPLLTVPFTPAQKDGQAVSSRKVLQILPLPKLGL